MRDATRFVHPSCMALVSPLSLDHAVVPTHDAAAARLFYRDVLGLPLVLALQGDEWGGSPWLMMAFATGKGGQHLVVTAFSGIDRGAPSPYPRDARHVAFAVEGAGVWEAWRDRVVAAKASHWEETHGAQRSLYIVDPSGNVLEITTPSTPPFPAPMEADAEAVIDRWLLEDRHRTAAQKICLDFHERGGRRAAVVVGDDAADAALLVEAIRRRWKSLTAAMSAGIAHVDPDADLRGSYELLHAMERVVIPSFGDAPPGEDVACIVVIAGPTDAAEVETIYVSRRVSPSVRDAMAGGRGGRRLLTDPAAVSWGSAQFAAQCGCDPVHAPLSPAGERGRRYGAHAGRAQQMR